MLGTMAEVAQPLARFLASVAGWTEFGAAAGTAVGPVGFLILDWMIM